MTRDDFPYSLQPYATPDGGGDGAQESEAWTLVLFRAADEAERLWFRDHGFVMEGRRWVRHAPAPDSLAEAPESGDTPESEDPGEREPGNGASSADTPPAGASPASGPTPDVAA
ncbi:hypothetical protein [Azospirillum isscasi]|uniref:Uncharacterized protein n=1 Tax=Azospirillum isscasi TaxID=3053926 RepID=A0ABU0WEP6_9PROT|nr:hypothetical protein [Azospirillum isscasi]MDQ2102548.1 hypothetical protein [Azospirillum isscasi]